MDTHTLDCLDFHRIRDLLAGFAYTGLGRRLAESIEPVNGEALIRRWLDQVRELHSLVESRGVPPFGGLTDVRAIVERCGPPLRVSVEDVAQIGAALESTHALAEYLLDLTPERPELQHLAERVGDFRPLAERIRLIIDERAEVRDDASPKLQTVRRDIEAATRQIHDTIGTLLRDPTVRRFLQFPNHTFHGDRLVLPLRSECRGRIQGIVHRVSDSGATLYVEPATVVELNNRISDLRSIEQEEIGRLLWELAHEIHLNETEIRRTLDALAVLDLIATKLRFARQYELHCPEIGSPGTLAVRNARHPLLLELARNKQADGGAADEVVPIDYRLGEDFNLLIVTGPNTGGKTVTLKTIGLLSLMTQAGLPIPAAEGARIGVFKNVLIDVGDEQSMQQSLSTFSGHLTRILEMLRAAGEQTLLLIDELGAGTDPDEGAALGRAILDEILRLKSRGVATTHLGALKGYALAHEGAENACVEFDTATLRPTFELVIGVPGQSNAISVARHLGMPKRLVAAASRYFSRRAKTLHAALEGTRTVKRRAEHARKEAETAKLEAGQAQDAAVGARERLERQQADFNAWVTRVVHLQPGDKVRVRDFDRDGKVVRLRLDQQRAEVDVGAFSVEVPLGDVLPPATPEPPPKPPRPKPAPAAPRQQRRGGKSAQAARPEPQTKPQTDQGQRDEASRDKPRSRPAPPPLTDTQAAALEPQDRVYVRRFNREGLVVRIKSAKRLAIVSVGLLEIEVPFSGLARPSG